MAEADAAALPSPPAPPPAVDGEPSPSSSAVPRALPSTLLVVPPPPSSSGGRARGARRGGGGGRRNAVARALASSGTGRKAPDRLAEAVRVVGRDVGAAAAGADILELAMAKGPMFEWLSYWPEEGFSKEDHPY